MADFPTEQYYQQMVKAADEKKNTQTYGPVYTYNGQQYAYPSQMFMPQGNGSGFGPGTNQLGAPGMWRVVNGPNGPVAMFSQPWMAGASKSIPLQLINGGPQQQAPVMQTAGTNLPTPERNAMAASQAQASLPPNLTNIWSALGVRSPNVSYGGMLGAVGSSPAPAPVPQTGGLLGMVGRGGTSNYGK